MRRPRDAVPVRLPPGRSQITGGLEVAQIRQGGLDLFTYLELLPSLTPLEKLEEGSAFRVLHDDEGAIGFRLGEGRD